MATANDILRAKGSIAWSMTPDATVYEARDLMADKNIGSVLVMEGDRLVGLLSERDYARKVILFGKSSKETLVREIMTAPVLYVRPDQCVEDCMALMTEKRVRHLPVLDGDRVVGIVSIGDVVKSIIDEQQFVIEQLERYVAGTPHPSAAPVPPSC